VAIDVWSSMTLDKLFPFLGIRGKLLVVFVALGIGPLGIVGAYTVHSMSQVLVAAHAEHLRKQLQTSVGHIESYLALLATNAEVMGERAAESGLFEDSDMARARTQVEDFFYGLARMRPDYYQIRVLSSDGREFVRINRYGARIERVAASDLQDKSDRYYFKAAMTAARDATYFSPMDLNVERGEVEEPEQLVFRVGRQVVDARGNPRGLVMINVFAHEILDRLKPLRPGQEGDVLLADEQGRFVREDCSSGSCKYVLGEIRSYLAEFPTVEVDALVAGGSSAMAQGLVRLMSYAPMRVGGSSADRRWRLAIVHTKESVLAPVQSMQRLFYLFGTLVAVSAFILAALATRALVKPIRHILGFVEGIAAGDFDRELNVETRDEIEQLARGVRTMANSLEEAGSRLMSWNEELQGEVGRKVAEVESLIEAKRLIERQLRRADRLASLGMLCASLAHEIGNPLASIKTAAQVNLQRADIVEPARGVIEAILREVDRLAHILERMTGFARPAQEQRVVVAPREIYRRVVFLLEHEAHRKGVTLQIEGEATEQPVLADAQKLEQVLFNLVANAVQATDQRGTIVVRATAQEGLLELAVVDTGPGIPEGLREQVFDPFVTTRDDGTGLGLAIVKQLVHEMDGHVGLEFPGSGGTVARIQVPVGLPPAVEQKGARAS
jgi:signal transduction histidine kinase